MERQEGMSSGSEQDSADAKAAAHAASLLLVGDAATDSEFSDSDASEDDGDDSESDTEAAAAAAGAGDWQAEADSSDDDAAAAGGAAPLGGLLSDGDSDDSDSEGVDGGDGRLAQLAQEAAEEEAQDAEDAEEAAADMRQAAEDEQEDFYLPSSAELAQEGAMPPNLPAVRVRMAAVVDVLSDFKTRRQTDRSRSDYMACLGQDMTTYYGYNADLVDLFLDLFSPGECLAFMESNEQPRPVVIRTNTLKVRRRELAKALMNRGVNVEPLAAWSKVAMKVYDSPVPIGATPEYMAGHYMLQAPSSMMPVMALGAMPGDKVLDMAAAPGGKTTHIAQDMRNQGLLVANDAKKHRLTSLSSNLQRLGVTCAVVSNYDGRVLPTVMTGFDRVLLDAPCSGLGVVARDHSIKTDKSSEDVIKMCAIQKQLALAAIDCLDANSTSPGGAVFVYSTCSVAVEENEAVVDYILAHRCVKLVPVHPEGAEDVGEPGFIRHRHRRFHPSCNLTRRFYPHVHNMDGFYVAKFKKYANAVPEGAAMPTGRRFTSKKGSALEGEEEYEGFQPETYASDASSSAAEEEEEDSDDDVELAAAAAPAPAPVVEPKKKKAPLLMVKGAHKKKGKHSKAAGGAKREREHDSDDDSVDMGLAAAVAAGREPVAPSAEEAAAAAAAAAERKAARLAKKAAKKAAKAPKLGGTSVFAAEEAPAPAPAGGAKGKSKSSKARRLPVAVSAAAEAAAAGAQVDDALDALQSKAAAAAAKAKAHKSGDAALAAVGLSREVLEAEVADKTKAAKKSKAKRARR